VKAEVPAVVGVPARWLPGVASRAFVVHLTATPPSVRPAGLPRRGGWHAAVGAPGSGQQRYSSTTCTRRGAIWFNPTPGDHSPALPPPPGRDPAAGLSCPTSRGSTSPRSRHGTARTGQPGTAPVGFVGGLGVGGLGWRPRTLPNLAVLISRRAPQAAPQARRQRLALPWSGPPGARRATQPGRRQISPGFRLRARAACSLCARPDRPASPPDLRGGGCAARDEDGLAEPAVAQRG
jgi:hypothetical protein